MHLVPKRFESVLHRTNDFNRFACESQFNNVPLFVHLFLLFLRRLKGTAIAINCKRNAIESELCDLERNGDQEKTSNPILDEINITDPLAIQCNFHFTFSQRAQSEQRKNCERDEKSS